MDQQLFKDPTKTFLDPSCGDGQFLASVLYRKLENGVDFETALSTIYGVDLMQDNVELCRDRLLCGQEDLRHIVEQNIVCADSLRYHYRFDGSHPYDDEIKDQIFNDLFTEVG
jgi:type I restriction-modification system DNA methylase subunit